MPLAEIAGEIVGGVFRFVVHVFLEVLVEILIKGPGYVICSTFSASVDPDGVTVILVGLLFWTAVGLLGYYAVYRQLGLS